MRKEMKIARFCLLFLPVFIILLSRPTIAGDTIVSINAGSENDVFIIEDEPSMVLNGFDLEPLALEYPTALDAVTIWVNRPVPGALAELLIYEDANAGSPIDATMIYRQQVSLDRRGANRIFLNEAAIITESAIWVGFYLPVGFRFNADVSGSSFLTYWAWTPGGTFDPTSLANAAVLGPGNGTEPVNIDMGGVARITAELRDPFHGEMGEASLIGEQIIGDEDQDTSILRPYPYCGDLLYDPEDIDISGQELFSIECGVAQEFDAPTTVYQPSGDPLDVQRAGHLFYLVPDIPPKMQVQGAVQTLPVPVTHCIRVQPNDLDRAIIAETRDIPARWHVLPSVRFGDLVCVELKTANYLSYFLPRREGDPQNVNLVVAWSRVDPHPLQCGTFTYFDIPVVNTGGSWFDTPTSDVKVIVEDIHVRTGTVNEWIELKVPTSQLGPGNRNTLRMGPLVVDQYVGELHRLQIRIDYDEHVQETNEFDNVWFTEYILSNAGGSNRCFRRSWLTATPYPNTVLDYCFVGEPYQHPKKRDQIWIPYSKACKLDFQAGFVAPRPEGKPRTELDKLPYEFPVKHSAVPKTLCRVIISVVVEGQKATVRFRKLDDPVRCPSGQFKFNPRIDDKEHIVLIVDLDYIGPTATPTTGGGEVGPSATPIVTPTPWPNSTRGGPQCTCQNWSYTSGCSLPGGVTEQICPRQDPP